MSMFFFHRHKKTSRHAPTGQSLIEYGLVIGLVAMVGVASLNLLGGGMSGYLTTLASNIGGENAHQPAAVAVASANESPSVTASAPSGASPAVVLADASSNLAGLAAGVPASSAPAENESSTLSGTNSLIQNEPTQTHADTLASAPAGTDAPATMPTATTDAAPATAAVTTTLMATSPAPPAASLLATQTGVTTDSAAGQAATLFCYGDSNICNSPVDSTSAWGW